MSLPKKEATKGWPWRWSQHSGEPFQDSLLSMSAKKRLLGVSGVVVLLWIGIAWAIRLP